MPSLVTSRKSCPACTEPDCTPLIPELDFSRHPLSGYFQSFYPAAVNNLLLSLALPPGELRACPRCGTVFHGVVPTHAVLGEFYSALQSATSEPTGSVATHREEQRLLELMMVVRFFQPDTPRPHVLDFGTGDGSWARLAAATGCQVSATDTAENAFPALRACNITCIPADSLPPATYDFINAEQVFEHLPSPAETVVKLATALRPGGVLKIGVPHDPELRTKLRAPDWTAPKNSPASLNAVAPIEHLNAFSPLGLDCLGRGVGLLPMPVWGFTLLDPRQPHQPGLRSRVIRAVRDRLGQRHRPPYTLAQTRFFLRVT